MKVYCIYAGQRCPKPGEKHYDQFQKAYRSNQKCCKCGIKTIFQSLEPNGATLSKFTNPKYKSIMCIKCHKSVLMDSVFPDISKFDWKPKKDEF